MDIFKSPSWDVDITSKTLNRQLFGSGKQKKVNFEKQQTNINNSSPQFKSSSSEKVTSNRKAFISKVKGKFGNKKTGQEDSNNDSSLTDTRSVKKRKKKIVGLTQATNSLQPSFAHKKANKQKLTMSRSMVKQSKVGLSSPRSDLNTLANKTKKSNAKLKKLTGFGSLPSLKSKRKHKFVVAANESNEEVENYRPLKSSKLPSTSPQSKNAECFVTAREKKKRKRNENVSVEESFTNSVTHSTSNTGEEPTVSNINSSNQIKKMKHNKPNKQKLKSNQPHSVSNIVLKDLKVLSRRNPGTLRERMLKKLQASRFRYLNEQMYCSKGDEAFEYFKTDPQAFQAYHHGYRQQVAKWPLNPLTTIISSLEKKSPELVVADFGCGDATLARSLDLVALSDEVTVCDMAHTPLKSSSCSRSPELVVADFGCGDATLARSLPNTVHSFDLVAVSDEVTVCDMAHTPLKSSSVDVAVFCLSLMGTNLTDYLLEANRILKTGGIMKIAEVESRFENVAAFIKTLMKYGFTIVSKDLSHNLFYFMDFRKVNNIKKGKKSVCEPVTLKPCLYKKR